MLELMEPECEPELIALALQHLPQGRVATEENCDLMEKNFKTLKILCMSHLANLLLSDLCKHLQKSISKKLQKIRWELALTEK